ncbi:hypothetical protein FQA47_022094 [Oryzias melastigma]|uniref:Uncharacterized protein n=1 Tax=Oryzias melastigma TaxID=30732 RepID=A0A834C0L7_ORYME|nr:hypothetical protein FQA47_022094 [Oryzias melastigma]
MPGLLLFLVSLDFFSGTPSAFLSKDVDALGRFTCRAELLQSNRTRSAQILITAVFLWSNSYIAAVCVIEAVLFLAAVALWQLLRIKWRRPAGSLQSWSSSRGKEKSRFPETEGCMV